jgi:hypothetical protein
LDVDSDLEGLVVDAATTVFWRNVHARKLEPQKPYNPDDSNSNSVFQWHLPSDVPVCTPRCPLCRLFPLCRCLCNVLLSPVPWSVV